MVLLPLQLLNIKPISPIFKAFGLCPCTMSLVIHKVLLIADVGIEPTKKPLTLLICDIDYAIDYHDYYGQLVVLDFTSSL